MVSPALSEKSHLYISLKIPAKPDTLKIAQGWSYFSTWPSPHTWPGNKFGLGTNYCIQAATLCHASCPTPRLAVDEIHNNSSLPFQMKCQLFDAVPSRAVTNSAFAVFSSKGLREHSYTGYPVQTDTTSATWELVKQVLSP